MKVQSAWLTAAKNEILVQEKCLFVLIEIIGGSYGARLNVLVFL